MDHLAVGLLARLRDEVEPVPAGAWTAELIWSAHALRHMDLRSWCPTHRQIEWQSRSTESEWPEAPL